MKSSLFLTSLLSGLALAANVQYTLNLTVGTAAPDGFSRQVYLVNGQTPGPTLVATLGDHVSVTVNNHLDVETTVHFHGITQHGSIWSDGVPGITQRMIKPGHTFVSNFTVGESGNYWYHAHSRAIYGDGIKGAFNILSSNAEKNAFPWNTISTSSADQTALKAAHMKPKVLAITDWTHWTSEYGLAEWTRTKTELLCIDSVLVNGKGRVICPPQSTFTPYLNEIVPAVTPKGCAYPDNNFIQPFDDKQPTLLDPSVFWTCNATNTPLEVISVKKSDKFASIAIVNQGALWDFRVSIDSHPFWVYTADGQMHFPQAVNVINVAPGERFTAIVKLNQPVGDYAIRVAASITPQFIGGYAVLSYAPTLTTPQVIPPAKNQALGYGGDVLPGYTELQPLTLKPFPAISPPQTADVTMLMEMFRVSSMDWAMNTDPFAPYLELGEPLLFNPTQTMDPDLVPSYPVGSVVDMVIVLNAGNPKHPLHKHGEKAYIIGQGPGAWTWPNVAAAQQAVPQYFNLVNPSLRDGFHTPDSVPSANWMVLRYTVTEPGVIFFHCHINIHTAGGMAVALMEGMGQPMPIPQYYLDWNAANSTPERKRDAAPRSLDPNRPLRIRRLE